jgi:hypothetical protein
MKNTYILQWILTKLGTYLVLKRIWNPIDFQGRMSKIKVTGSNFYRITSLWTLTKFGQNPLKDVDSSVHKDVMQ